MFRSKISVTIRLGSLKLNIPKEAIRNLGVVFNRVLLIYISYLTDWQDLVYWKTDPRPKMFANFTPRIQQIKITREQLEGSVNTLIETRNELRGFLDTECATASEWQDFEKVSKRVDQLSGCAVQLTERANSRLQIAFVGSVGAGKSTLINTLLGEDIMPVTRAETTFCNVAITGTSNSQWKAVVRQSGKTLANTEFKQLLHVLKAREQRERFGITPSSVIDVHWPSVRCKALVESVVLYDTPGIGERKATDDAVIDLCKTVDVIVAVMDIHSPTLRTVSKTEDISVIRLI